MLRRSIFANVDGPLLEAKVGTTLKYGAYLEKGVKGGKAITPTRKKALAFPGWVMHKGRGKKGAHSKWGWVVRPKVIQGEIKARPFIESTIDMYWPTIFAAMMKELKSGGAGGLASKLQVRGTNP